MRLRAASNDERLFVCYEAGYDGFWLARSLAAEGVDFRVLDPASLQVNRRARRVKTGRIDVLMLVRALIAIDRGDGHVCAIVNVPTLPSGRSAIDPRAHRPYQPQGPSLWAGVSGVEPARRKRIDFFGPAHRRMPPAGAAAKKFFGIRLA
jgi:transposase